MMAKLNSGPLYEWQCAGKMLQLSGNSHLSDNRIPSSRIFRREFQPNLEAFLAARFVELAFPECLLRLAADDRLGPDFEVLAPNGDVLKFQLAEVLEPGRKRREEYAAAETSRHSCRDIDPSLLYGEEAERRLADAVRRVVARKSSKPYSKDVRLLIYVNMPTMLVPSERRLQVIRGTAAEAHRTFSEVWCYFGEVGGTHKIDRPSADPL